MKSAKAFGLGVLLASAVLASAPASAATTVNFQTASLSSSTLSDVGDGKTFKISDSLWVTAYAWNATPTSSSNSSFTITQAKLGDYFGGLGVISAANDDFNVSGCDVGDCGQHQIDNIGDTKNSVSYDFVQLVFTDKQTGGNLVNVNISSLTRTAWGTGNAALTTYVYDDDFSIGAGGSVTNGSTVSSLTSLFTANYGSDGACNASSYTGSGKNKTYYCDDTTAITGDAASSNWYVAASIAPNYGGDGIVDGLKLKSIAVTAVAPVPEPASWTMMILGFGVTGTALRRRKALAAVALG